jgi:phospho-N-acetylmuramoyl-pentapeptide-transferase
MSFQLTLAAVAFALTVIWGSPFIQVMKLLGLGKKIRMRGAVAHKHLMKEGTPTFGGLLIIVPAILVTIMVSGVNVIRGVSNGRSILVPLAGLVLFGAFGFIDDWEGIKGVRAKGDTPIFCYTN